MDEKVALDKGVVHQQGYSISDPPLRRRLVLVGMD
jgi:hypothetical protein